MDSSMLSGLVAAGSAIGGSIIGGWMTLRGVGKQIEVQNKLELIREKRANEIAEMILATLVLEELRSNHQKLYRIIHFRNSLRKLGDPFQWGYSPFGFSYQEFDQIKHELLKYIGNAYVERTFDIYASLKVLDRYDDINQMSGIEYRRLKNSFFYFEDIFYEKPARPVP